MATHPILINNQWRPSKSTQTFTATNPKTREPLPDAYPVSGWDDIAAALAAAASSAPELRAMKNSDPIANFLDGYASAIEKEIPALATTAATETGLAFAPRLSAVELPRTINQLRQAAATVRDGSWARPTIDTKAGIRSCLAPIGPVWTIGPNNFPFAYNGISGGDFAAAIAAGNPVIAKAHPLHPSTSRLLGELARAAAVAAGLPAGTVQMLYHMPPEDGLRMIADHRLKAIGFTGSRAGGLKLKAAADAAGKLFFGEMSSINPIVILPGALGENATAIADQLATSVTMGTGQFCTKPGVVLVLGGRESESFIAAVKEKLAAIPTGTLFSKAGESSLCSAIKTLQQAGAELLLGGGIESAAGYGVQNTLLRVPAAKFLAGPGPLQTEAFGNAVLMVVADNVAQLRAVLETLEGNLTGAMYSAKSGSDDSAYDQLVQLLRSRVGRLLNDKMPTGVAVSSAMQHGGPYPATSQPHFTAVGFPASVLRFTQLESFDNVREHRLPLCLRDKNPNGMMRFVDGKWTTADV
jgi:NADP-dependent aldehyde dehydrogenase